METVGRVGLVVVGTVGRDGLVVVGTAGLVLVAGEGPSLFPEQGPRYVQLESSGVGGIDPEAYHLLQAHESLVSTIAHFR